MARYRSQITSLQELIEYLDSRAAESEREVAPAYRHAAAKARELKAYLAKQEVIQEW